MSIAENIAKAFKVSKNRIDHVGNITVIHVDKPTNSERKKRLAEVRRGGPRVKGCEKCEILSRPTPAVVVFDWDYSLYYSPNEIYGTPRPYPRRKKR